MKKILAYENAGFNLLEAEFFFCLELKLAMAVQNETKNKRFDFE